MAIFTKKVAEELFGELWTRMIKDFGFGKSLKESGISIYFVVTDPDMVMFVDENGPIFGAEAEKKMPVVTMKMKGDIVHKFWLKDLNVPMALALRQVVAKGPVNKVLQLLPLMKPGMEIYPEYCKKFKLPMKA
ncbi:MAG: hypothetical protein ACLQDF_06430 [Desulfomonilia bacterium]